MTFVPRPLPAVASKWSCLIVVRSGRGTSSSLSSYRRDQMVSDLLRNLSRWNFVFCDVWPVFSTSNVEFYDMLYSLSLSSYESCFRIRFGKNSVLTGMRTETNLRVRFVFPDRRPTIGKNEKGNESQVSRRCQTMNMMIVLCHPNGPFSLIFESHSLILTTSDKIRLKTYALRVICRIYDEIIATDERNRFSPRL
jgi:hypothetical protein